MAMPWALAAAAAQQLQRFMQHPWLRNFGRGAAPAVVGLLIVAALHLARNTFSIAAYAVIAGAALALALWTKLYPLVILLGGPSPGQCTGF